VTFLAPAFLFGLLAVGLPLWLHRLSSDNPNRQPFSSLMFLEAGEPRRVLAKKLQYLLLLALRIGLLALLVLAFMQPAFWRDPAAASGDDQRLHVIVLDTSASMAAGDRWDDAEDAALDVLGDLPADDRAEIVAAGRTLELVAAPTLDRSVLRQGIVSVRPGIFHLDYGQLMRSLDGILRGADLPVVLHVVTDAQRGGLPTRFAELAPTQPAEIRIHSIAGRSDANWAVESLVGSALSGELTATVRNLGDASATKTLTLTLNDDMIERRSVTLEAGARTQVDFDALTLDQGSNRVRAFLSPGDVLPDDDERLIALKRPEPRPVLVVAGTLRGDDTLFLASAMESLEALALEVQRTTPGGLADQRLEQFAFVVAADIGAIGTADQNRLAAYVENGGALLMGLAAGSASLGQVPITGEALAASGGLGRPAAEYVSIGTIDTSHPALAGVETMRAAEFYRHTALTADPADRVLISLETGAPLLLERELGAGRVLLFTSSLNRDWNDLPLQPVFVPFVAGVSNHLLGGAGFSNEAALGSTMALRAMGLPGGQIFDPQGDRASGLGGTDDVLLDQTGFYELVGGGRSELVAVNFDIRESDLAALDASTLERWQELGRPADEAPAAAAGTSDAEPVLAPLGRWLLMILLAVVVMESWVGNWHLRVRRGLAA
jgi:Aerotolerance regulator N-terminal/von Willebrand factor type A domain